MRKYEMMIIYDLEAATAEETNVFVKDILAKHNVEIVDEKNMGVKELAYEINRKTRGHYFLFNMLTEQKSLPQIERLFKLSDNVMRYLILNRD